MFSRISPRRLELPLVLALILTVFLFFLLAGRPTADAGDVSEYAAEQLVARIYYDDVADIERLPPIDLWEVNNLQEKYVLAFVSRTQFDALRANGWEVEVDAEETLNVINTPATFLNGYRTVDEIVAYLQDRATTSSRLAELVDYGDSFCKQSGGCPFDNGAVSVPGDDLLALRITNRDIPGPKPVFFLVANIHAREITTPELAMRFIDWLLDGYATDPDATWLVDHHEIWVVPTINPDGHRLVEQGELDGGFPYYQRKNGNGDGCNAWPPSSSVQPGVDLNRNHSFEWGGAGTSTFPCDQTYRGDGPASEPETAALQALISSVIADQNGNDPSTPAPRDTSDIVISLHSYSQLVLYPWGYITEPAPNADDLKTISDRLAVPNGYTSCQPSDCLYSTSGSTDDWSYGELGVASFTFEVGSSFMPPFTAVDSTQWPRNRPAFIYAAKIARTPYLTAYGPDTRNVQATLVNSTTLQVEAAISEQFNGGQNISAAALSFRQAPWVTGTVTTTLSAVDGNFDSPTEAVTATLDVGQLDPGRYLVYVYGQDANGNWGPVSADFVVVEDHVWLPAMPRATADG